MHLLRRVEVAIAEDNIVAGVIGRVFRAARHFGKEGIANVADQQADGGRLSRDQAAGNEIRPVIQGPRRCPGCGRAVPAVLRCARSGRGKRWKHPL